MTVPCRLLAGVLLLALVASACHGNDQAEPTTKTAASPSSTTSTTTAPLPQSMEVQLAGRLEVLNDGLARGDGYLVRAAAHPSDWIGCDPSDITENLLLAYGQEALFGTASSTVSEVEVDLERNVITSYRVDAVWENEAGESETETTTELGEVPIVEVHGEWYIDIKPCDYAEELSLGSLTRRGSVYWDGIARGDFEIVSAAKREDPQPTCQQRDFDELYSHMPRGLRPGALDVIGGGELTADGASVTSVPGGARTWAVIGVDRPDIDLPVIYSIDYLMFRRGRDMWTITGDACTDLARLLVAYADDLATHDLFAAFGSALAFVREEESYESNASVLLEHWDTSELAQIRTWGQRPVLVDSLAAAGIDATYLRNSPDEILLVKQSASGRWFCFTSSWRDDHEQASASSLDLTAIDSSAECRAAGIPGFSPYLPRLDNDVRAGIEVILDNSNEVPEEAISEVDAADVSAGDVVTVTDGPDRLLLLGVSALGEWYCAAREGEETRFGVSLQAETVGTFDACWEVGVEGYWLAPPLDPRLLENLKANWEPVRFSHLDSVTASIIEGRGTINIGYGISEPFAFADETGFEIDLGVEIVHRSFDGVDINWVPLSPPDRFAALADGRIDVLLRHTAHTVAREEFANWTSPYYLADRQMVFPSSRPVISIQDLDDGYVGILWLPGFQDELGDLAVAEGVSINVYIYEGEPDFVTALGFGTIDAAYLPTLSAAEVVYELGAGFEAVPFGEQTEPIAVATPLDDPAFRDEVDAVLREIIADGTLDALHQRWFGSPLPWTASELRAVQPPG